MPRLRTLAIALAALAAACSDPTDLGHDEPLVIRADGTALEFENTTGEPIYTVVLEREDIPAIEWIPCTSPAACDGLAAGVRRRLDYQDIVGYDAGDREAVVFWWHLRRSLDGGYEPDRVRGEIVRL